jgi:hypothetical protein
MELHKFFNFYVTQGNLKLVALFANEPTRGVGSGNEESIFVNANQNPISAVHKQKPQKPFYIFFIALSLMFLGMAKRTSERWSRGMNIKTLFFI